MNKTLLFFIFISFTFISLSLFTEAPFTGQAIQSRYEPLPFTSSCRTYDYVLHTGDTITVGGHTIRFLGSTATKAEIDIDGSIQVISAFSSKSQGSVTIYIPVLIHVPSNSALSSVSITITICEPSPTFFSHIKPFLRKISTTFRTTPVSNPTETCVDIDLSSSTLLSPPLTGQDFCLRNGYTRCDRITLEGGTIAPCTNTIQCNQASTPKCWTLRTPAYRGYDSIKCCRVNTPPPTSIPIITRN
ncbi:MAG: hypothetical protein WC595_06360 [Candidatus Nanoarchaeia archaeon]